MQTSITEALPLSLSRHAAIGAVKLAGSRARGEATGLSDWDFTVETRDFAVVAEALSALVAPLEPLAQQWDRLSVEQCYMLMLRGAVKVDLIFDEPHQAEPPWVVSAETLRGIDDHFWDWTIWLAAKDRAGKLEIVETELQKMHEHLLAPLGIAAVPASIEQAVAVYAPARADAEARLALTVPQSLEDEVRSALLRHGYVV